MERLLTAREAAEVLRINRYVLYELARCGEIPAVRIRRMVRFRPEELKAWVESKTVSPTRASAATKSAGRAQ